MTPSKGDTRMIIFMADFRKNTGQRTTSEGGSCDEATAKKVITLQKAMTKRSSLFL